MQPRGDSYCCALKAGEDVCIIPNLCEKVYSVRVVCCSLVTTSQVCKKCPLGCVQNGGPSDSTAVCGGLHIDELDLRLAELTLLE